MKIGIGSFGYGRKRENQLHRIGEKVKKKERRLKLEKSCRAEKGNENVDNFKMHVKEGEILDVPCNC